MNATEILNARQPSSLGATARSLAVVTTCILLTGAWSSLSAQQASFDRLIYVTVSDPLNRFVTGLEQEHFGLVENGVHRAITHFENVDSPIAIAIVGMVVPPEIAAVQRPEDELIQSRSLPDALRELAAAKNSRKALMIKADSDTQGVPSEIQVLKADENNLFKTLIEVRNRYSLGFSSSAPASIVEVTVKAPRGLPPLKVNQR